jgi:RNA polymerase sigma-70 factor (ECF subfamily)
MTLPDADLREPGSPLFAATRWSLVLAARDEESPEGRAALEELCRTYWYPLYAHIRSRGFRPEDAQDLTQDLMASLLRRRSFDGVSPDRGRFRSYLLAAAKYFLSDHQSHRTAVRRGGGAAPVALDGLDAEARYALEPSSADSPDRLFDRRWSMVMMERVFARLGREMEAEGKSEGWGLLQPFLAGEPAAGVYEEVAGRLGTTTNALAQQVRRLRLRCRQALIEEAAQTLAVPGEAEAELRALFG